MFIHRYPMINQLSIALLLYVHSFLPIVLLDFRSNKTLDGRTRLQWTLAPLDQSVKINLLHSTDNQSWQIMKTWNESMNGSLTTYEFVPATCNNNDFYKVQIIPKGSDTVDSKIIPLMCETTTPLAYPNPARDYLMVSLDDNSWSFHSIDGKSWVIPATPISNGQYQLDLRSLPIGYYVLKFGEKRIPILHL